MVGMSTDSCPCCGHKRQRPAPLARKTSCPAPRTAGEVPRSAKIARSSSCPSHSCVESAQENHLSNSVAAATPQPPRPPLPLIQRMPSSVSCLAETSLVSLDVPCAPVKEEVVVEGKKEVVKKVEVGKNEEKKEKLVREVPSRKRKAREVIKIWGAHEAKISIKCKCGSVQEVALH